MPLLSCTQRDPLHMEKTTMTGPRTKTIEGYRIQPMLPIGIVFAGGSCLEADFTVYDGTTCVEALVRLGNGMVKSPYTLVLSIEQALEADIIERA
jgi:hypothetical protein